MTRWKPVFGVVPVSNRLRAGGNFFAG